MMTEQELSDVIATQKAYSVARRANANTVKTDNAALRKAWLKQKFGSFEYHEFLLRLHEKWLDLIYTALARPEVEQHFAQTYRFFSEPAKRIFDDVALPGQLNPAKWKPGCQAGYARDISDYNRDTGLDVMTTWEWLTKEEEGRIFPLWGYMNQMAENIRMTVDGKWFNSTDGNDDSLLNELYTGIIDWPPNWMNELPPEVLAAAQSQPPTQRPNVPAGQPCPEAGWWHTPAKPGSRRFFRAGETMPDTGSDYGQTFWQWSPDQSAPAL